MAPPVQPRETVLVVDDNLQNRLVAEGFLESAGYDVILAEDGPTALERFAYQRPDLVLLDILMPGMDGFEVCRRLRASSRGAETPILFLTALQDQDTHRIALDSGGDDYLTKPIQRVELLLRVRSLLRIKRLHVDLHRRNRTIAEQRDALLRAQELRRRLFAMVVHDLKNPLSSVRGNVQYLLEMAALGGDFAEALQDIDDAALWMNRLVLEILDLSRSEDQELQPRRERLPIAELMSAVVAPARRRVADTGQRLEYSVAPGAEEVHADRDLLQRVLANLVDNCTKYAPRGTAITLTAEPAPQESAICFCVRDQGPGVPQADRDRIFDPYTMLEDAQQAEAGPETMADRSRLLASRGLGLAFCKLAVEAHGGSIRVEDNQPRGSTFRFTIPGPDEPPPSRPSTFPGDRGSRAH